MDPGEPVFPLVPRWRLLGTAFEAAPSERRGPGADIAGTREYVPGDDVRSIDWRTSARLSLARESDEFVVREHYGEDAPRVVLVYDRHPSMGLYPDHLPWLAKPAAADRVADVVLASAARVRGSVGYLDAGSGGAEPVWLAPSSRTRPDEVRAEMARRDFDGPEDGVAAAFEHLCLFPHEAPPGTFFFVLSDFLRPIPESLWEDAFERRWDVVPVILQDPVWEQSFPDVSSLVVTVSDPASGRLTPVRLGRAEVERRRLAAHERLEQLTSRFAGFGMEPVLVGAADRMAILDAFLGWAAARAAAGSRS
jgi:uncharacterized protein (DUF58 family)